MYVLEDDVYVDQDEKGKPILSWKGEVMMVDKRPTIELPVPNNCHPVHYGWRMNWYYETPPGYSVLITHPMNRFDLPFYTMSGIVESDIWGLPVFTAFFLKKNFIGKIEKGTPIFQMIPFKRDNWKSERDDSIIKEGLKQKFESAAVLSGFYKKNIWKTIPLVAWTLQYYKTQRKFPNTTNALKTIPHLTSASFNKIVFKLLPMMLKVCINI